MYVVIVEFTLGSEHIDDFVARVRQQAADSLEREAGCHVFDVCLDPARENYVLLYEVYDDRAAFETHLASAHFLDFDATVGDWVKDKRVTPLERL